MPAPSAVAKLLSRLEAVTATTGAAWGANWYVRVSRFSPPLGGGTTCQLLTPPSPSPTMSVRSPSRKPSAVTGRPGLLATATASISFGEVGSLTS